jgi:hypothetical protein
VHARGGAWWTVQRTEVPADHEVHAIAGITDKLDRYGLYAEVAERVGYRNEGVTPGAYRRAQGRRGRGTGITDT